MHAIVSYIKNELQKSADPDKAKPMQAYMKTSQSFYGVQAGQRKIIFRKACTKYPIEAFQDYQESILSLWDGTYREENYMALEIGEYYKKFYVPEALPFWEDILERADNWDTVDWIASNIIGRIFLIYPQLKREITRFSNSPNMWIRRTSLLVHLKHKDKTDTHLLAESIIKLIPEKEFFIRKAIGWILREYSKTNPEWVLDFVEKFKDELSGLSKREALKVINSKK